MPAKKTGSTRRKSTAKATSSKQSKGRQRVHTQEEEKAAAGDLRTQILGMALLLVGILLAYSLFAAEGTGVTGYTRSFCTGLAGAFALLIPLGLCWIGLTMAFLGKREKPSFRRIVPLALLLLLFLGFVELFGMGSLLAQAQQGTYIHFLATAYHAKSGGGILGALTAWPLYVQLNLRVAGSIIVYLFSATIILVVMRKINLFSIGKKAADGFENVQQRVDRHREERETRREEQRAEREAEEQARAAEMVVPKASTRRTRRPASPVQAGFTSDLSFSVSPTPQETVWKGDDDSEEAADDLPPFAMDEKDAEDLTFSGEEYGDDVSDILYESCVKSEQRTLQPEEHEQQATVLGSRLIEPAHVYKREPAQPLSSFSEQSEMKAPIHTDMLEKGLEEEPVAAGSLFSDRVKRANAEYTAAKDEPARAEERKISPFGPGIASGPENRLFSDNPIFGVQKPLEAHVPMEYNYPPVDLLQVAPPSKVQNLETADREKGKKLVEVIQSFGIATRLTGISHGPTVTRFELAPAPGVKVSRITGLVDDIALGLAARSIRIEAPIPGKSAVGIELPNDELESVPLREVLESPEAQANPSRVAAAIGRDNGGRNIICDLAKMPHLLIAGTTGSGKSVCINCIICSILYRATPEEVRLIMIDPKMVELSVYNDIPHLLVPVVTDPSKAAGALQWVVFEMTQRYKKFAATQTRDIVGYNKKRPVGEAAMPQIVVIIDELADLMLVAPGDVEDAICRIAQLARAAGIHLVVATQRPSVNVITGVIKANISSRIAFTVPSQIDSRTILDMSGAEKLLMHGDMLYAPAGMPKPLRVQGAWISDSEVQSVVQYIRDRHESDYSDALTDHLEQAGMTDAEKDEGDGVQDDLLPLAIEQVVEAGQASISMLQRKLRIGYARAGRLIDEMDRRGYVGPAEGSKPRDVLLTREQFHSLFPD